ncbi:GumC family protein [Pseudanabaena mucicola]|uniref:Lipopolysaccharide biosynthesis protein n=1 Tax=Pseudanabaena mucicola FACHB-723 TaxID=2692860 RepID=A0ABR7ZXW8_9CYAN|nr:hypothetical protein [Pseudanabaena mucicola]MBD2188644.1 hypothetical protein [Pseudanabaena mucicola FACHB-723]
MTKELNLESIELEPPMRSQNRGWLAYLLIGIVLNGVIWGGAIMYLKTAKPKYVSRMAIILPGGNVGANVNLPSIGQASSSSSSASGGSSLDPRANYQYILTDDPVLEEAAKSLNIKTSELGKPKSKLIDNTSILQVEIEGPSAKAAQERGFALHETLMEKVNKLRADEIARRDDGTQTTLDMAKIKLAETQQKLATYKSRSGLSTSDQVKEVAISLEQLRKQRAEMLAQDILLRDRLQQLSNNLGLDVNEASDAFTLQSDPIYQQNLRDYSDSSATLTVLSSKWGENHPNVVKEAARQKNASLAVTARASFLLKRRPNLQELARLNLNTTGSAGKESLYRDLVAVQAEQSGIAGQAEEISRQIENFDNRLRDLTQKQLELDRLQRDAQVAEAVFASSLAKIDLSKSDIFTAYPLAQLVSPPSLAEEPASPQPKLVLAGAFIGSLFVSVGAFLLWKRQSKNQGVKVSGDRNDIAEVTTLRAIPSSDRSKTG